MRNSGGVAMYVLIVVIIAGAFFMVNGGSSYKLSKPNTATVSDFLCCDSGDGDSCKPGDTADKTLTYKGVTYGLLKTTVELIEGNLHLIDSGETFGGKPIILNSSQDHIAAPKNNTPFEIAFVNGLNEACKRPDPVNTKKDLYFLKTPADPYLFMRTAQPFSKVSEYCTSVPDDEIIFVCKENCTTAACSFPVDADSDISCYGNNKTIYDVYYRSSDYTSTGVPEFIKDCDKTTGKTGTDAVIVPLPNQPERKNLQLQTFGVALNPINPGLSPFCKPAIYLYPEKETQVSVKVSPAGKFTYTDPIYPENGWTVTAHSDGKIFSNNKEYPYLYYEANIPSLLIEKPKTGYVVDSIEIESFLRDLLPRLGLNVKETIEMSTYWQKALPKSPYYFIGIISKKNLDNIAPLTVSPAPTTTIRVALYFEPLDKKIEVEEPSITKSKRAGFTVVEWGGIIHSEKPFTCLQ